jgi:hypothetical protein
VAAENPLAARYGVYPKGIEEKTPQNIHLRRGNRTLWKESGKVVWLSYLLKNDYLGCISAADRSKGTIAIVASLG